MKVNSPSDGDDSRNSSRRSLHLLSGRYLPEFRSRRSIRQMLSPTSTGITKQSCVEGHSGCQPIDHGALQVSSKSKRTYSAMSTGGKEHNSPKRRVKTPLRKRRTSRGTYSTQFTLEEFFKSHTMDQSGATGRSTELLQEAELVDETKELEYEDESATHTSLSKDPAGPNAVSSPVKAWSKIMTPRQAPRCESHGEPCISLVTKKAGINQGRSFWMCRRPLGPRGTAEKGTQWKCPTFIWCNDWEARKDTNL
ncbi:Class II abasic (AP) endonuclease [Ascosphaera aggregata]|nr:Class II abasic (AP) endonuclease [Ascosphaera aggregata]